MLLRVEGDSMADDLRDGAVVFVDRGPAGKGISQEELRPSDIYMVTAPGEKSVTLRRVTIHGGLLTLEAGTRDRRRFPLRSYPLKGLRISSSGSRAGRWTDRKGVVGAGQPETRN